MTQEQFATLKPGDKVKLLNETRLITKITFRKHKGYEERQVWTDKKTWFSSDSSSTVESLKLV